MGLFDFITDAFSLRVADAEAPSAEQSGDAGVTGGASAKGTPASGTDEESSEEKEVNEQDQVSGGGDIAGHKPGSGGDDNEDEPEDEPEEEEEEEEDEPEDMKPKFEEECMKTQSCAPIKHHYDECVERVTSQMEENDGKSKENCVEEFFHLAHCASNCAAPKLFKSLK